MIIISDNLSFPFCDIYIIVETMTPFRSRILSSECVLYVDKQHCCFSKWISNWILKIRVFCCYCFLIADENRKVNVLEIQLRLISLCNLNVSISYSHCEKHDGAFHSLQVILLSSIDRLSLIEEQALSMNFHEFIHSGMFLHNAISLLY